MGIDRHALAEFLRSRREALQPEDVGLPRGTRRRTAGLRREEVAMLCHMSTDYYSRLERQRGPHPSAQMVVSMAQGLRLSPAERDHLFRLAGHEPPSTGAAAEHLSPGMLRIFDRLHDTPAEIVTELGETLLQTPPAVALTGNLTDYTGPHRSIGYRWFADLSSRDRYDPADHEFLSRLWVSGLRSVAGLRGPGSKAAALVAELQASSAEFRRLWDVHEVGLRSREIKHFIHPEVGALALNCQNLLDPSTSNRLLVYTAEPGTESYDKLQLLSVIGAQSMH